MRARDVFLISLGLVLGQFVTLLLAADKIARTRRQPLRRVV